MIVIGVDPGSQNTGYAFLQQQQNKIKVLEYGVIRLKSSDPLPQRLEKIFRELKQLMDVYAPQAMALESIFFAKFPRAAMVLGHARGAIMVAAHSLNIPVTEYAPRLVKQSVVGRGGASKEQVAEMMQKHLQLKQIPQPADAADALAIAFCHLVQSPKPI